MRDASMGIYYEDDFQTTEEMEGKVQSKLDSIETPKP